jgi:hypothetical protein
MMRRVIAPLKNHRDVALFRRDVVDQAIEIVPLETVSRPAIIRSSVLLPQPEGPTRTMSSPSLMSKLAFSTAT